MPPITPGFLIATVVILAAFSLLGTITRSALEVGLIRLAARMPQASFWQVWKDTRHSIGLGWTRAVWRVLAINALVGLALLPLAGLCLLPTALPLGMDGLRGGAVSSGTMVVVALLALLLLTLFAIPASLVWAWAQMAERAAVLDDLPVLPALRRAWQVARCHSSELVTLWLVLAVFSFMWALVILPPVAFIGVLGMGLAWIVGALVFVVLQNLLSVQAAFAVSVLIGGVIYLLLQVVPLMLVDGMMSTYVSVSWTRAYEKMRAGMGLAEV